MKKETFSGVSTGTTTSGANSPITLFTPTVDALFSVSFYLEAPGLSTGQAINPTLVYTDGIQQQTQSIFVEAQPSPHNPADAGFGATTIRALATTDVQIVLDATDAGLSYTLYWSAE